MSTMYHLVTGENHLGVGKVKTVAFQHPLIANMLWVCVRVCRSNYGETPPSLPAAPMKIVKQKNTTQLTNTLLS